MSTVITEPAVDVVVLGLGTMGGLVATQLAVDGYDVAGIDKGPFWDFTQDFSQTKYDEWGTTIMKKYDHPLPLFTTTMRNYSNQFALPIRRYTVSQFPANGHGVGGAAHHYSGGMGRTGAWNYTEASSTASRYGPNFLSTTVPNADLFDWPYTYTEMDPYYVTYEAAWGMSGTNMGPLVPMSQNFPLPPHPTTPLGAAFQTATEALGYSPFPVVSALASAPYMNSYGVQVNECVYDGWCSCSPCYPCETGAKANTAARAVTAGVGTGKLKLALNSYIFRINTNQSTGLATSVSYYDAAGNIHVQPGTAIFTGLWTFNQYNLLAKSGIGKQYNPTTVTGALGRGACNNGSSGTGRTVSGTLPIGYANYQAGNGAGGGFQIYDFADDAIDHTGMAQPGIGGPSLSVGSYTGNAPSDVSVAVGGTVNTIGSTWKATQKNKYIHSSTTVSLAGSGVTVPTTDLLLDLDPFYSDYYGDPLTRFTETYNNNSVGVANLITPLLQPILTKMGCTNITMGAAAVNGNSQPSSYSIHVRGGGRVGASPTYSCYNAWHQSWDVNNVFAAGELQNTTGCTVTPGTHTIGPMAYVAVDGIKQYLKSPQLLTGQP
jgi:gluconate 2-dehydrogenase alpha chain